MTPNFASKLTKIKILKAIETFIIKGIFGKIQLWRCQIKRYWRDSDILAIEIWWLHEVLWILPQSVELVFNVVSVKYNIFQQPKHLGNSTIWLKSSAIKVNFTKIFYLVWRNVTLAGVCFYKAFISLKPLWSRVSNLLEPYSNKCSVKITFIF